jgi:hypothetical protein
VRSTAHSMQCRALHAQCTAACTVQHSTAQCSAQHTQCVAEYSTLNARHGAARAVQGNLSRPVQHSAGQGSAQHTQCASQHSTHSAVQGAARTVHGSTVQCSAPQHTQCSAVPCTPHTVRCGALQQSSAVHMLSDTRTVNSTPVTNFFAAAPKLYVKQRGVDSPEFDVLGW